MLAQLLKELAVFDANPKFEVVNIRDPFVMTGTAPLFDCFGDNPKQHYEASIVHIIMLLLYHSRAC